MLCQESFEGNKMQEMRIQRAQGQGKGRKRGMNIDSTDFGSIVIDGKKHNDVLIIGNQVFDRNTHDSHIISNAESEKLLKNAPEIVIIGTGIYGALKVEEKIREKLCRGNELIITRTGNAAEKYNELSKNKRVNALLHSTC